ncbi:MAG: ankyrin repeat domain-containing protein [Ignavibacteria bacterium]|nr:ankyrin repeat domain-containing protein [Ignavibacteria bacterium]
MAKAVADENPTEIKRIVAEEKVDIDFQEQKFGITLLMLSIKNHQLMSCKTLLELGANVHKYNFSSGRSAIMEAAEIESSKDTNSIFLRLLLEHGANPNDEEVGARGQGNRTRKTPLVVACSDLNQSPLEKVKLLVEAGADINHKNEYDETPLKTALSFDHYDVMLYLLQKGAEYKDPIRTPFGSYNLCYLLRFHMFPLDTKEYKQKMEVVEFLRQKGIDYQKKYLKIWVKEAKELYPDSWKEYLEKY